jgi:hypothetical protein
MYTHLQILTSTTATAGEIKHLDEAPGTTLTATSIGKLFPWAALLQAGAFDFGDRLRLKSIDGSSGR